VPRPPWISLVALSALALGARPAIAVKPCFDVCHLGQGTPLLLADADQLWLRRCAAPAPDKPRQCALERVSLDGRVLERVPHEASYDEDEFETDHLKDQAVVRFGHQSPWTDLAKAYTHEPYKAPALTLRFDRDVLLCAPVPAKTTAKKKTTAKQPKPARYPLGCTPTGVHVFAAGIGPDGKPEDPTGTVAVVATCAEGQGTRESVAICRPPR
jgi:hypothetical protein